MKEEQATILVVEDFEANMVFLVNILTANNYITIKATNGTSAVNLATEHLPNLILLDINLPDINGFEVIEKLKLTDSTKQIPVIFLTALNNQKDIIKGFKMGAVDYLTKPFVAGELLARIHTHLELKNSLEVIRKQKEKLDSLVQQLSEHNQFINRILDAIPVPIVVYNEDGMIKQMNMAFTSLFDHNVGDDLYENFILNPDNKSEETDSKIKPDGKILSFEKELTFSDTVKHMIIHKAMCINFDNSRCLLMTLTDITELKKIQEEIVSRQQAELINTSLKMSQMNEVNKRILHDIDVLSHKTSDEGAQIIRKIKSELNTLSRVSFWDEFELRFNQVYGDFEKRISKKYPELTSSDIRLCVLLRMNLSTKEISSITMKNVKTIDMTRYRIRKKLKIEKSDNLVSFLTKI